MTLRNLALFALTALLLNSCNKEKTATPNYPHVISSYSLPDGLEPDYFYKPGTYWVFRDSATGVKNTISVTASELGLFIGSGANYREIQISLHQSDSTYNSDWKWALSALHIRLDYKRSYRNDDTALLFWNYPLQKTLYGFSVNGKTYDSVAEIRDQHPNLSGNVDVFYMSDSVGFIKMRLLSYPTHAIRILELEEYNIVR